MGLAAELEAKKIELEAVKAQLYCVQLQLVEKIKALRDSQATEPKTETTN